MATPFEKEDFPSLSKSFDDQLKKYSEIENSQLSTSDEKLQEKISSSIKKLEELTVNISYLGVFSSNESVEEISTNSIKFLMLPFLLGTLTLKYLKIEREEALRIAAVYFKDFLQRCSDYQLTTYTQNEEHKELEKSSSGKAANSFPSPKELERQGRGRIDKIARYKQKKALAERASSLKEAVENKSQDEDVVREYYLAEVDHLIHQSHDELESLDRERDMLQRMKDMGLDKQQPKEEPKRKPFGPFLITKDSAQKKVFGAGYPSLPVLSVDEFYEQRVKDGWFPPRSEYPSGNAPQAQGKEEEEEEEDVERLRARDEWRDTHKTGWGNRYNRS